MTQVSLGGSVLRRYRQQAGLTQEQLAERAGLSVRGIQDLERGVSRRPRRGTVDLLATALGLQAKDQAGLTSATTRQTQLRPSSLHPARSGGTSLRPLVGRTRELTVLDRFLGESGDEPVTTPLLLFAGEPGIGKTRLLEAARQAASGQGWRVLFADCRRQGIQQPYAPILDAVACHLQTLTPDQLSTQLAGCAWMARLLPELTGLLEHLPAGNIPVNQERRLMFGALRRLLANVAGPAGTLLLVDNLQWAGVDTLDFLAALLHLASSGAAGAPLRIVGAYRDTEVGPADPFGLVLADLARSGLVKQHMLGPLDRRESATMLTDLLGGVEWECTSDFDSVLKRAEGTPFFLVSYAVALLEGSHDRLPWELEQGIRQQIAQVPEARELLGVAAVIGRKVPWVLLLGVLGQPEAEMLGALDAACGARLLVEKGEDAYAFGHELIREVVEADLGAARRAVLHRRVAETLEGTPGVSPKLLAFHYSRSDARHKALHYLEGEGDGARAQGPHRLAAARHR